MSKKPTAVYRCDDCSNFATLVTSYASDGEDVSLCRACEYMARSRGGEAWDGTKWIEAFIQKEPSQNAGAVSIEALENLIKSKQHGTSSPKRSFRDRLGI